jgi:hypothetical protein
MLSIPDDPLPSNVSSTYIVHRLVRESPNVLILEPGPYLLRCAFVSIATLPIVVVVCLAMKLESKLTFGFSLFPVFAAGGAAVGHFIHQQLGMRARIDRDRRDIVVSKPASDEIHTLAIQDVVAVQHCDMGVHRWSEEGGKYRQFQVNLVLSDTSSSRRLLLNNAKRQELHRMAQDIANFLGVPFYVGSKLEAAEC